MTHFFQIVINHIVYFSEVLVTVQYICVICISRTICNLQREQQYNYDPPTQINLSTYFWLVETYYFFVDSFVLDMISGSHVLFYASYVELLPHYYRYSWRNDDVCHIVCVFFLLSVFLAIHLLIKIKRDVYIVLY